MFVSVLGTGQGRLISLVLKDGLRGNLRPFVVKRVWWEELCCVVMRFDFDVFVCRGRV